MQSVQLNFVTNSSSSVTIIVFGRRCSIPDKIADQALKEGFKEFSTLMNSEKYGEESDLLEVSRQLFNDVIQQTFFSFVSKDHYGEEFAHIGDSDEFADDEQQFASVYIVRYALEWLVDRGFVQIVHREDFDL